MFLYVEGTRVESPLVGHDFSQELSHREGQQLGNDGWDGDVGVSEEEELQSELVASDNGNREKLTWLTPAMMMAQKIPRNQTRQVLTIMVGSSMLDTAARTSG
jgi:hypothetical protein